MKRHTVLLSTVIVTVVILIIMMSRVETRGNKIGLSLAEAQQIAAGVTIGDNTTMESSVTIGDNISIAQNTRIAKGTNIGGGANIAQGASIAQGTKIAENTRIAKGTNIGGGALIGVNNTAMGGVTISQLSPGQQTSSTNATQRTNVTSIIATPTTAVCDGDIRVVTLEGRSSQMVPVTTKWEQTGGEPDVFIISSGPIATFPIPSCDDIDGNTTLTFQFSATNREGTTNNATVDFVVAEVGIEGDDE